MLETENRFGAEERSIPRKKIRRSFPEALVVDYERLISKMLNNLKDRHVLAAAAQAGAGFIATYNRRHFFREATKPWGVETIGPSDYLERLLVQHPELVIEKFREQGNNLGRSLPQQLDVLYKTVPSFVEAVRREIVRK